MTLLKERIEAGEYRVDSRAVAGEMVAKLLLVQRIRRTLLARGSAGGGTPRQDRS